MKPRGIAYSAESLAKLPTTSEADFARLENVIMCRPQDFPPFLIVKVLEAFTHKQCGSSWFITSLVRQYLQEAPSNFFNNLSFVEVLIKQRMLAEAHEVYSEKIRGTKFETL